MQSNRRKIHLKKRKILKNNCINPDFIQIPNEFFRFFDFIVIKNCIYGYINLYEKFMGIFDNLCNIFQRIAGFFTCTKRISTDVYSICACINCSESALFILCRSKQFNCVIFINHYKNYTIIKKFSKNR